MEISFSKTKLIVGLIIVLCCLLLSILALSFGLGMFARNIIVIGILFWVIGIVAIVKKMFSKVPAIIINEQGIIDNTKNGNIGVIEWNDISHISIVRSGLLNVLLINICTPEKYLERLEMHDMQKLRKDYVTFGTPFAILPTVIAISLPDLEALLNVNFHKYKKGIEPSYT